MAKDPAINWYFDNWSGGTKLMSRFIKGCYMDLLDAQFHSGHLSLEEIKTVLGADFSAWSSLSKKFAVDETGKYFNERMEHEILKREKFSNKQKDRINKRWNKSGIDPGNTAVLPIIETGIETGTKTDSFEKSEKLFRESWWPSPEDVERFVVGCGGNKQKAEYFFNKYEALEWKMNGNPLKRWQSQVKNFLANWQTEKNNATKSNSAGNSAPTLNYDRP
jgi:hypothetical protein